MPLPFLITFSKSGTPHSHLTKRRSNLDRRHAPRTDLDPHQLSRKTRTMSYKSPRYVFHFLCQSFDRDISLLVSVPTTISDLTDNAAGHPLDAVMYGGAPASVPQVMRARKAFPIAAMYISYRIPSSKRMLMQLLSLQESGVWYDRDKCDRCRLQCV